MKTQTQSFPRRLAFTLIELLVVMAVIAVLAAMIFPAAAIVKRKSAEKRIQTMLDSVASAIETYYANVKVYPPENPINPALGYVSAPERNTLFYELSGVQLVGGAYQPAGGRGSITEANLRNFLQIGATEFGIVNLARGSGDESKAAHNSLSGIRPTQYMEVWEGTPPAGFPVMVLGVSDAGPLMFKDANDRPINPFRYASTRAANNVGRFDLWVDVIISGKTNRFSNWSTKPIIVSY
jgi:prepilin-type N-terminal cleavage/methylation domain-containing protein